MSADESPFTDMGGSGVDEGDDGLSRRLFIARLSALAAGAAGSVALPGVASAAAAAPTLVDVEVASDVTSDPTALTVAQAATLIRRGRPTSEELVRACLERTIQMSTPVDPRPGRRLQPLSVWRCPASARRRVGRSRRRRTPRG